MGIIHSMLCSITFCLERVLTWTCCACLLIVLMGCIVLLMAYGIMAGYHYAQKELASFAAWSRSMPQQKLQMRAESPVVRLLAVNRSEEPSPSQLIDVYKTRKPGEHIFLRASETPIVLLETERSMPQTEAELTPHERELARRLIGRFRRSRNNTSSATPFFKPLKNSTTTLALLTT